MSELMELMHSRSSLQSISYHSYDENEENEGTDDTRSVWQRLAPAHEDRLYYIILSKSATAISDIVQNWIDRYELDSDRAVIELLQLFVDLASYQYINVENFLEHNETSVIVPHMENTNNSVLMDTGKYFLSLRTNIMKKKHEQIGEFLTNLLANCASGNILTDFVMLKQTVGIIQNMADSLFLAIKHTGVYLAVKYQTGLIDIISQIIVRIKKIEDKIERKGANHRLQEKLAKYRTKYEHANKVLGFLFLNIFNKNWCFGDRLCHYMRQDCISEIITWIDLLPSRFLQKHYLNHIITSMTDSHSIVRYEALDLMSNILNIHHEEVQRDLVKYLIAMKNMMNDSVVKIQVRAVEAFTSLSQLMELPRNIQERLILLMCSTKFKVAAACGVYYVQKENLNSTDIEDETEILKKLIAYEIKQNKKGVTRSLPFVLEAIYEACPRIQRLSLYTDFLKQWGTDETILPILLQILTEVVRIGMSGYCSYKRKVNRIIKVTDEDKRSITRDFILAVPTLMNFYDVDRFRELIIIVDHYKVY